MKRKKFVLGVPALLLILALVLAGCGGGNPKALAKQHYEQTLGAMGDPAKVAKLEADFEKKVAKLSEKDRAIYFEELFRLAGNTLEDLFKEATDAADGTEDVLKAASSAAEALDFDAIKDAAKAASSAAEALDTEAIKDAANAVNSAANAVNSAANALKSFGF